MYSVSPSFFWYLARNFDYTKNSRRVARVLARECRLARRAPSHASSGASFIFVGGSFMSSAVGFRK